MCEKCEDRDRMKETSCALCSTSSKLGEPEKMENVNREVKNYDAETKRIDEELRKRHKEMINGYDDQLEKELKDLANFSTKMLIMFEDYRKKGDMAGMIDVLKSIRNYSMLAQTSAAVVTTTVNSLLGKMQGAQ